MRIAWAIPCRGLDTPPDGAANILGAGTNHFIRPALPAQINVVIALNIVAREDELGSEEELRAVVLGPSMEPVSDELQMPVGMDASPNKPPGWEQNAVLGLGVMFEAGEVGTHTIQFSIGGRDMSPVALYVGTPS